MVHPRLNRAPNVAEPDRSRYPTQVRRPIPAVEPFNLTQTIWCVEIFLETVLVSLFILKNPNLRWWEAAIGVDWLANVLQFLPYSVGLHRHAQLIWISGVAASAPLLWLAMVEAWELPSDAGGFQHVRVLAFWIASQLTCVSLQTQFGSKAVNPWLLGCDSLAFAAWIRMLLRRE
jgi:hypothetical protein